MPPPFIARYLDGSQTNDRPALVWSGGQLTHGQLLEKVRRRMSWLRSQGLSAGDRLVIHLPKGPLSVECLLAGMALGCVAVPIDPLAPDGRAAQIIDEIEPSLILQVDHVEAEIDSPIWEGPLSRDPEDPALILMTSGSTGTPKGIVLSHGNMAGFIDWTIETFDLGAKDRFVSIAPFHFDLSMLDIYAGLLSGGCIYLPTENEISFPGSMAKIFEEHKPTILYAVPSMLQIFQRFRLFENIDFTSLRWLLFAGEVFPIKPLRKLMSDLPQTNFANLFGPTETNVFCWHEVKGLPEGIGALPIGKPCNHSDVAVLSENGKTLPDGETGEICVSGPTVMKGYWKDKRIESPQTHGDYFRTGDYGYFEDGLLHFAGRRDDMAKIRGIRFSLKEVEAVTLSEGSCDQAVAIIEDKNTLVAKVVLHVIIKEGQEFSPEKLKAYLDNLLPQQAVPASILQHFEFPYTSNGKIDRLSLSSGL